MNSEDKIMIIYATLFFTVWPVKLGKPFPNLQTEFGDKNCGCQVGKSASTAVTANRRASWLGKTSMWF